MHQFFRKNNKKLLALVGIFLMISFVATARMPNAGDRIGTPVGKIGDQTITSNDVDQAKSEFELLARYLMIQLPGDTEKWRPLLTLQGLQFLAPLGQEPRLYCLLQKEAQRMAISVTNQPIDLQMSQFIGAPIHVQTQDGRIVDLSSLADTSDSDFGQSMQVAGEHFLSVLMAWNRAADVAKISRPMRDLALAQNNQSLQVQTVVFEAKQYADHVKAPTTQQLQAQFDAFADVPATGFSTSSDPMGFGYQIPTKFHIETIAVPRDALTAVVKSTKTPYDWDVAAHYYYDKHQSEFPTTAPAPEKLPPVVAAPVKIRPFDEVKGQIMTEVMRPQIDELSEKVNRAIRSALNADWSTFHAAHPQASTAPSTSPSLSSSLGVSFDDPAYLPALAAKVQKDLGVLPVIQQINQPVEIAEAGNVHGIGMAHSADGSLDFSSALADSALLPMQPSVPLVDDGGTSYVFRFTQRIDAHRPSSLADTGPAVERDWRLAQAYELCKADAAKLADAAKKSGLPAAATAAGLTLQTPDPFMIGGQTAQEPIKGLPLSGDALDAFRRQAGSLLTAVASHTPPVTTVESPITSKVMTIELSGVTPQWPSGDRRIAEAQANNQLRMQIRRPLQSQWFNLQAVMQRLGYVELEKKST